MSRMAGFDAVLEFGTRYLDRLVRSAVHIAGAPVVPMAPPFVHSARLIIDGATTDLRLLVLDPLEVSLDGTPDEPSVRIVLRFRDSSIRRRPRPGALGGLSGAVELSAPIALRDGPPLAPVTPPSRPTRPVAPTPPPGSVVSAAVVDLAAAAVIVRFDGEAAMTIERAFERPTLDAIRSGLGTDLVDRLRFAPFGRALGQVLQVTPSVTQFGPGAPAPDFLAFQVSTLALAGIVGRGADRSPRLEALGVFVRLLPGTAGDPSLRTVDEGPLVGGDDDVALSLSAEAFRRVVFCPELPPALGLPVGAFAMLPPPCGPAPSVSLPGTPGRLTSIDIGLVAPDLVRLVGSVEASGTCFEATARFEADFAIRPTGIGTGVSLVREGPPRVDVDFRFEWYCYLVLSLAVGAIEAVALAILDGVIEGIVESRISSSVAASPLFPVPVPTGTLFVTTTRIDAAPDGLTALSRFEPPLGAPLERSITVDTEVLATVVDEEFTTVHHAFPPDCAGAHQVVRIRPTSTVRVNVTSRELVGEPLRWFVGDHELTDEAGTVRQRVRSIQEGGTEIVLDAEIGYVRGVEMVELTNHPDDGTYSVLASVQGTETTDGTGPRTTSSVEFSGTWLDQGDYERCRSAWAADRLRRPGPPPGEAGPFPGIDDERVRANWLRAFERGLDPEVVRHLIWPAGGHPVDAALDLATLLGPVFTAARGPVPGDIGFTAVTEPAADPP